MAIKKRTSLLAVTVILAMVVTACGGGKSNEGNNASPSAPASAQATGSPDAAQAGNDKPFTIRVGSWFIDDRTYQQNFKSAIEEHYKQLYPNAIIQWDITLGETYVEKLTAQFASKSAPDVVFYQVLPEYAQAGYLADLSAEPWVQRLSDSAKIDGAVYYDGKLYGLSMGGSMNGGIWYNTTIFENLGLQVPETVEQLMDVLEKIKQAGITPIALGFKDQWTAELLMENWVQPYGFGKDPQYGMKIYNEQLLLTEDPAIRTVLTHLQTMKEKDYFNKNALSIDWPQSAQLFASGEAAMIIQGPWMPGANKEHIENGGYEPFQIGFIPLMSDTGSLPLRVATGTAVGVNAESSLSEEAKALVNVIAKPEIYGPFIQGEGAFSSLTDVDVTYEDEAMNTVIQYVNQGAVPYKLSSFIPRSTLSSLVELVTKVVSGGKFDPADLQPASDNLAKDKGSVSLPPQ